MYYFRPLFQGSYSPVFGVGGEKVGFYESKGGHSVSKYVGAPQQGYPVVKDDGGRKPVEVIGVDQPKNMSDDPTLQPVDLILVNQACGRNQRHRRKGKFAQRCSPQCFVLLNK